MQCLLQWPLTGIVIFNTRHGSICSRTNIYVRHGSESGTIYPDICRGVSSSTINLKPIHVIIQCIEQVPGIHVMARLSDTINRYTREDAMLSTINLEARHGTMSITGAMNTRDRAKSSAINTDNMSWCSVCYRCHEYTWSCKVEYNKHRYMSWCNVCYRCHEYTRSGNIKYKHNSIHVT